MPEQFQYDVFLSHSAKDTDVVRPFVERLLPLRLDDCPSKSSLAQFL